MKHNRNAVATDMNFIYSTWLRGLYYGNEHFKQVDKPTFMLFQEQEIDKVLSNSETSIVVSCMDEDADVLLGFAVYSPTTLHWVFVKESLRKNGVAKSLVPSTIRNVSAITKVGNAIRKAKGWAFVPWNLK